MSFGAAASAECPCGGGAFVACCGPLLSGAPAVTALQLMRSRYTAFVRGEGNYLLVTWHPRTRPSQLDLDDGPRWSGLEILDAVAGAKEDSEGVVEFRARYAGGALRERSRFARRGGRWVYVDGEVR